MFPFRRCVSILVVGFTVSIGLIACSKKDEGGISPNAVDSELLERLPTTTVGYVFSDSKSAAYGAFKSSQWYQSTDAYLAKVSELSTDVPAAKAILNALNSTALFKADSKGEEPIIESVFFAAKPSGAGAPEVGVFAKTRKPLDAEKVLASIESALKNEGFSATRQKVGEVDVIAAEITATISTATLPGNTQAESTSVTLKPIFVVLPDRFGTVSSANLAERLIKPLDQIAESDRGIRTLKAEPSYQRAMARAAEIRGQFILGFADVNALTTLVKANAPAGTPGVSDGVIDELPIETVSFCRSMNDGLSDYIWLGTKEGALDPELKAALAKAGRHPAVKNSPPNPVGILSIDGTVLRAVRTSALKSLSPEERTQAESISAPVDTIQGLSLIVRNAAGASPFPELTILLDSEDPAALQATLKQLVGGLAAGGGLPVSAWQTKEIEGAKIDFMASPIGVGVFMGTVKNILVISTADAAISDLLGGKTAPEVEAALAKSVLNGVSAPLALFYTSGDRIAHFLESLQASMAMFTGGKSLVEPDDMKSIRSLGTIGTAVNFTNDALQIKTSYLVEKSAQ